MTSYKTTRLNTWEIGVLMSFFNENIDDTRIQNVLCNQVRNVGNVMLCTPNIMYHYISILSLRRRKMHCKHFGKAQQN